MNAEYALFTLSCLLVITKKHDLVVCYKMDDVDRDRNSNSFKANITLSTKWQHYAEYQLCPRRETALFCKMTDTSSNKSGDTFLYFQIWAHPKAGENRKLKESLS